MEDIIKKLKYIDLKSITIIGTSINFIWSVILAIILLILFSLTLGSINVDIIFLLLAIISAVLILSISDYFGSTYLFNFLIPRVKEINLEIIDMEKITNISVFPLAFICSVISLIITVIMYPGILIVASILSPFLQFLANQGGILLLYVVYFFSNPLIIAYAFIFTFISVAIAAFVFNIISPKIGGLKLELTQEGDMTKISSLNYLNLALILAIIFAVLGLVIGVILSIVSMNLAATLYLILYLVLGGFLGGFIIGGLVAVFYNFLAPRMGELKIKLV